MPSKKTIFLTGGLGFVGRNILEQLSQKYKILSPGRGELDLLDSGRVADFLKSGNFDVVIHAAGSGVSRSAGQIGVYEHNNRMFLNLAQNSNSFSRMIFLGSGAEYDKRHELKQVKEEDFGKNVPVDEYGLAKYTASKYIETTDNIVNLRCFGVYGKYEDASQRFISSAICNVLGGKPITIGQNVWFDYLYVGDLVKIIDYFITHDAKHKFYNVASGRRVDLLTLAGIVENVSGSKQGIVVLKDGMNKEYTADNSRLKSEIPDFKFTSLESGIKRLYEYYLAAK